MGLDARIRYTKKVIRESFVTLLKQKKFEEITLKEVCELAGINRSTYYRHYKDIYDWRDQMEAEYRQKIQVISEQVGSVSFEQALTLLLRLIQSELDIMTSLLYFGGEPSTMQLIHKIFDTHDGNLVDSAADEAERTRLERLHYYRIYGCSGLIVSWFIHGAKETPEEMAHQISLITGTI